MSYIIKLILPTYDFERTNNKISKFSWIILCDLWLKRLGFLSTAVNCWVYSFQMKDSWDVWEKKLKPIVFNTIELDLLHLQCMYCTGHYTANNII